MTYLKKVVHGTILTLISSFLVGAIGYVLKLFLARSLSVQEYGLIFAIVSFFNVLMVFYNFGIESALVKFIPEFKVKNKKREITEIVFSSLLFQTSLTLVLGLFVYLFRNHIFLLLFKVPVSNTIILIGIVYFVLSPLNLIETYFRGMQKITLLSVYKVIKSLIMLSLTYVFYTLVNNEIKLASYLLAYCSTYALIFISILGYVIIKKINILTLFDKKLLKTVVSFGIPIYLVSLFSYIFNSMDELFISYFSNFSEVGYYNVADSTVSAILTVIGAFAVIYVPVVAEMWAKKEFRFMELFIMKLSKYLLVLSIPITMVFIFYSEPIINILFTDKFENASLILMIYAPAIILIPLTKIFTPVLLGAGETKYIAKISIVSFLVDLIGNILLVPRYGGAGAEASSILGMVVLFVLVYVKVHKMIRVNILKSELIKILFLSLIFLASIGVLNKLLNMDLYVKIAITLSCAGAIYLFLIFYFGLIKFKEIETLIRLR